MRIYFASFFPCLNSRHVVLSALACCVLLVHEIAQNWILLWVIAAVVVSLYVCRFFISRSLAFPSLSCLFTDYTAGHMRLVFILQ